MTAPMIRLAVLCDHAMVGQDGKVSVLGIFRSISVSDLPAQHPRMFLVAVLGLAAGPHTVIVRPRDPEGRPAMQRAPEMNVHSSGPGPDVNVIVELNNMSFSAYGDHFFDLEIDGSAIGSVGVSVIQMPAGAPGGRRAN